MNHWCRISNRNGLCYLTHTRGEFVNVVLFEQFLLRFPENAYFCRKSDRSGNLINFLEYRSSWVTRLNGIIQELFLAMLVGYTFLQKQTNRHKATTTPSSQYTAPGTTFRCMHRFHRSQGVHLWWNCVFFPLSLKKVVCQGLGSLSPLAVRLTCFGSKSICCDSFKIS